MVGCCLRVLLQEFTYRRSWIVGWGHSDTGIRQGSDTNASVNYGKHKFSEYSSIWAAHDQHLMESGSSSPRVRTRPDLLRWY